MNLKSGDNCPVCTVEIIDVKLFAPYGLELYLPKDRLWSRFGARSILRVEFFNRKRTNALYCKNCGMVLYYLPEKSKTSTNKRL